MSEDGEFDVEAYRHAIRVFITAMEIIVDLSSYPTERIAKRSHDFRPLGLGYANLGTFLMLNGIPYDSSEGRAWAGALSAILSGHGYQTSAEIASNVGTFNCFEENQESMLEVMRLHRDAAYRIDKVPSIGEKSDLSCPNYILDAAREDWDVCLQMGERFGYRNSQISVIAPTGTIALLMDCDTTGIEPDFALVKFKKLAGGGYFKIVNRSVAQALEYLGYANEQIEEIITYIIGTGTLKGASHINEETLKSKGFTEEDLVKIEATLPSAFDLNLAFVPGTVDEECLKRLEISSEEAQAPNFNMLKSIGFRQEEIDAADEAICGNGTIEGAPHLKEKHYSIFDCANKCGKIGTRSIKPMGHVRMIAAVQPFISGAISKTVNLTNDATADDIKDVYVEAWKLGVKCMSIYRDGSKSSQPLSSGNQEDTGEEKSERSDALQPIRKRLPDERQSVTHKFSVAGHDGYITVGFYDDGSPGEVFLKMSKEGSVISGLIDTIATMTSILLQYGVPLESLVDKFSHVRFEPSGFTSNQDIPIAKSIIDYVFRWLGQKFLSQNQVDTEIQETFGKQVESTQLFSDEEFSGDLNATHIMPLENQLELREKQVATMQSDAPPCQACGSIMVRNGTCYRCLNCGATSGCS